MCNMKQGNCFSYVMILSHISFTLILLLSQQYEHYKTCKKELRWLLTPQHLKSHFS